MGINLHCIAKSLSLWYILIKNNYKNNRKQGDCELGVWLEWNGNEIEALVTTVSFICTLSFVKASLCRRKAGEKEKKKARWARWAVEPLGGDKSYLHDNSRLWQSCKSYVSTAARNFCGLTIFCVLRELIDEIRTDWFFLLGVSGSIQYTALIIFSFSLSTCNRNTYFQTTLRYAYPINVKPVIHCIPFCFGLKEGIYK